MVKITKILSDKEYEILTRAVKEFVNRVALQFNITTEDAIWKIKRELDLIDRFR